ncbi:MAG: N-succinylarginine dihydrolase [Polyangiaceae bacterium]|nr:N-succinylarginine dihydrolase [Polyangiaceae bacterium]
MREYNFDGLVGPTHQYAGLSHGNLASTKHRGTLGNPRAAALQGLGKMQTLARLGVGQAVLPPQPRPLVGALRALGFAGTHAQVLVAAHQEAPELLLACSSASAMWAANAATVAPSTDTGDGRVHFTVANLSSMFHRSLEARQTEATLSAIFADESRFVVHPALPSGTHFSDEGAANHTRLLVPGVNALHLFGWGRRGFGNQANLPSRFPARQTLEASQAVARLHQLPQESILFWQQAPQGIDQGAFHTDVLAVGHNHFFLFHEQAFCEPEKLEAELQRRLSGQLVLRRVSEAELGVPEAVQSYLFNSQLVTLPAGGMAILVPEEVRANSQAEALLQQLLAEPNPLCSILDADVNASMKNGGGPACLRLRVVLSDQEVQSVRGRVFLDEALGLELTTFIGRRYRDQLALEDLRDPMFLLEVETLLDELTQILQLGSIYPFQR